MNWRKAGRGFLFPPLAFMIVLIPVSTAFLVYSMLFLETSSFVAVTSYILSFYTLMVWCFKIPRLVRFFKTFKEENKYARKWRNDERLRVNVSLYGTLIWNIAYALLQLGMGIWHHTFWFCSLAGYYFFLAVMRFSLLRHTRKHAPREKMVEELGKYRACGIILLLMNMALSLIIFFMVYWNRTFVHHEITTIALAAYTFTSMTRAIINMVKYRKYNSPVYSASKSINLVAACVSMLTLESTMLTTFGDGTMDIGTRKLFLAISGAVVSVFIISMAIFMIVRGTKKMKSFETS